VTRIRAAGLILACSTPADSAWACGQCWPLVLSLVYRDGFASTLMLLLAPVLVLAAAGAALHHATALPLRLRGLLAAWFRTRR
jgi:hypothetical protein